MIAAAVHHGANTGVLFGLVFLVCGLAFKVSAAPFHMRTPDVYEGAPTPVVGLLIAAAPKFAAMVAVRPAPWPTPSRGAVDINGSEVVIAIAVISMLLGAFAGLVQKNLKRLLEPIPPSPMSATPWSACPPAPTKGSRPC